MCNVTDANKRMVLKKELKICFDRSKPKWTNIEKKYSIGYANPSTASEGDIQFTVSLDEKEDVWIWEVYRADVDRVIKMGHEYIRNVAEQQAFDMTLSECNSIYREKKPSAKTKAKKRILNNA